MPTRYFIAQILGNGDADVEPSVTTGGYRAAVSDHPDTNVNVVLPNDPVTGRPRFTWALAMVTTASMAALLRDPQLIALPDVGVDTPLDEIDPAELAVVTDALLARGAPASIVDTATTFGELVRGIGRHLDQTFSAAAFGVAA